jgi:asparagine synthase (glutamine-hydrolysing)
VCGVAGFYGLNAQKAQALLNALAHRGPDDSGVFEGDLITLVHRRLSVQDIALGRQPMQRGDLTIVFNGEIYNHIALRKSVEADFKTRSDTETLLALYQDRGANALDIIDGMFAFAIYNKRDKTLFLARDRYGKKPLYYSFQNGFMFASEINALTKVANFAVDRDAAAAYFGFGFIPFDRSIYKEIIKLNAGSWLKLRLDTFEIESGRFFSPFDLGAETITDENEAIEQIESALSQSVKSRLESSDVEVGSFLSGGIDSSLVSFYAAKERPNLQTFTVRFAGNYDESPQAEATAKAIGSAHMTIDVAPNMKEDIESILARYGEPFSDSSAIPSFYVAKAARERVKVVLNGDGADELFAGYRRYVPIANGWFSWARRFSFLAKILPKPAKKISAYNYLYRLIESAGAKTPLEFWLKTRPAISLPISADNLVAKEVALFLENLPNSTPLSLALLSDQALLLFGDLLPKMDIATMAVALEARSPFLSRDLSYLAPRIDDRLKIRGAKTKYILRRLALKRLGKNVANAPKRGFEVPLANWAQNDLKEPIEDLVLSPNAFWRDFLDKDVLNAPFGREGRAKALWTLFCFEIWNKNRQKPLFS